MANNSKKRRFSLLSRLFGNRNKERSFLEEEQLQSPGRLVLRNFLHNKLGMTGLILFLAIFLFVLIAPQVFQLDLGYQDNTQSNVPPTMSMMSLPDELKGHVVDIAPGTTYAVGVSDEGKVYTWGHTRITDTIDLADIPEEVQQAKIVKVAAGYDHIVALDENGGVYVWGNTRLGQDRLPNEISRAMRRGDKLDIVQIEAGFQFSAALTADGELYLWGNMNMCDLDVRRAYQGHIKKIALTTYSYIALLDDGSVAYTGLQGENAISAVPEAATSNIVDIAATGTTCAAVDADGNVIVWGSSSHNETAVPEMAAKPVELYGGIYHYTALLENGDVVSWGDNTHDQGVVPAAVEEGDITDVYAGFYQNYAVTATGEDDYDTLDRLADKALYEAKRGQKNQFRMAERE